LLLPVCASSAIRWCALARLAGSVVPGPLGGDRHSSWIETHAALILGCLEQKADIPPLRATTQTDQKPP